MIPNDVAQNVIETARIEEVVADFITLKRRGANYIANCPFHNEKTPSFYVSPSKGIYKCFGCGAAGNSVKFIMEHEHLGYPDALRYLAKKYNITIEEAPLTPQAKNEQQHHDSLYIANQFAADFFQGSLFTTDEGRSVGLGYFKERGFLESTIQKFGLGYALEAPAQLLEAAQKKGFNVAILRQLGLIAERGSRDTDFFRARVMFPIHNASGKVIAFAGRTLSRDKKIPKYVNSPETPIYHKSKHLFGLHLARQAIRRTDECILVEGYADVISLVQAGIENVVASSGTSLTIEQAQLIKRYAAQVLLLYDGDEAGIKAALRGTDKLIEVGLNVRIVVLPDSNDPDSYLRKVGIKAFKEYLQENSQDFVLFMVGLRQKEANNDPIKKATLIKDVIHIISKVDDALKRSLYMREISRIMDVSELIVVQEVNKARLQDYNRTKQAALETPTEDKNELLLDKDGKATLGGQNKKATPIAENLQNIGTRESLAILKENQREIIERDIVRVLLEYGHNDYMEDIPLGIYIISELEKLPLQTPVLATIAGLYREQIELQGDLPPIEWFVHHTDPTISTSAANLLSTPYELSPNWEKKHNIYIISAYSRFKEEVAELLNRYKLYQIMEKLEQTAEAMRTCEREKNDDKMLLIMQQYQTLLQAKANLTKVLRTDIVR